MSKQMIFALMVELFLITMTVLLLTQPSFIFRLSTDRSKFRMTVSGLFLLCVTFCWSVVFGCVVAIQQVLLTI